MSKENSKIGVLIPGMGAVASTFICGVIACNKGLSKPIGSMTQMGSIRLGKRSEDRSPVNGLQIVSLIESNPFESCYQLVLRVLCYML